MLSFEFRKAINEELDFQLSNEHLKNLVKSAKCLQDLRLINVLEDYIFGNIKESVDTEARAIRKQGITSAEEAYSKKHFKKSNYRAIKLYDN